MESSTMTNFEKFPKEKMSRSELGNASSVDDKQQASIGKKRKFSDDFADDFADDAAVCTMINFEKFPQKKRSRLGLKKASSVDDKQQALIGKKREFPDNFADGAAVCTVNNFEKFPREKMSRSELRNASSVDDKQQASIGKKRKFSDDVADGAAVCTMTNFEKFPQKKRSRLGLRKAASVDHKQQALIEKKREFSDKFADGAAVCVSKKSKAASTVNGVSEDGDLRGTNCQMDAAKKKQCGTVLRKLMTRRSGWLFSKPVDPVKLKIPDYFEVISKPMDLGTIKNKLERESYSSTAQFAADVTLTFSNAMIYNPPSDSVHIQAMEFNDAFDLEWKSLESQWGTECSAAAEIPVTNGAQKRTVAAKPVMQGTSSCTFLTSAEKLKMRKQLPELLPKPSLRGQDKDILDVDIEKLDEETFREVQKKLRSCADARTTKSEGIREKHSQILKGGFRKDVGSEKSSSIKEFARHSVASKLDSTNTVTGAHNGYPSPDVNVCAINETDAIQPSPRPSGSTAIPTKEKDNLPCEELRSIVIIHKDSREKQLQNLKGDFRKDIDSEKSSSIKKCSRYSIASKLSEGIREKQPQILKGDFRKDAGSEKSSGIKKFARHSIASKVDPKNTNTSTRKGYSSAVVNGCAIDERHAVQPSPHPFGPAAIPTKEVDKLHCEEPRSIVSKDSRENQSQSLKGDFRKDVGSEKSSTRKKCCRYSIASKLDSRNTNTGAHKGYSSAVVNGCAIDERHAVQPSLHPFGPAAIPTKEVDKLHCEELRSIVSKNTREKQSQNLKGDFSKDVGSKKSYDIKKVARHSIASKSASKNAITGTQKGYSSLDANGCAIDETAGTAEPSPHPCGPAAIPTIVEAAPPCEEQLSPRALRAKELKKRFAVTILRAEQNKLMDNGAKREPERMHREWKAAEKQQREVRLRIKAEMEAEEAAARMKAEAERKMQTAREREASRLKMQNMQKTVVIDENIDLYRDLEKLGLAFLCQ